MFLVLAGSSTPIESRSFSCLKVAMDITFNVFEYSADRGDSFGLGDVILCEKVDDFVFHDHHHVMIECAFVERSEEHTSELQSRGHLVCRLLLEKINILVN